MTRSEKRHQRGRQIVALNALLNDYDEARSVACAEVRVAYVPRPVSPAATAAAAMREKAADLSVSWDMEELSSAGAKGLVPAGTRIHYGQCRANGRPLRPLG